MAKQTFFDVNIFILKVGGVWVPRPSLPLRKRIFHCCYNAALLLYCVCVYQPAETAVLFKNRDFMLFIRSLRDQFNHFICMYKIFVWFAKNEQITAVMEELRLEEFRYETHKGYDPKRIVKDYKVKSDRWSKLFLCGVNGICLNMALSVLYVYIFRSKENYVTLEDGSVIYDQPLPVTLLTPFEQTGRLSLLFHFLFEIIALDIYGWIIIGLDTLFTSMMSCLTAQFKILGGAFETIRPRCLKRLNLRDDDGIRYPEVLNREMMREMNKCTRHLQKLIEITARLEEIYNFQTLGQVMVSLFEMCFCLYLLSFSFNESFGNEFTYLFSTAFELLLYCWFGNGVIEASNGISGSIFGGDWLGANGSFKKSMLITMIRMNRPVHFTIAKFTPLTFHTFLSMARIAYSFYTVLRTGVIGK